MKIRFAPAYQQVGDTVALQVAEVHEQHFALQPGQRVVGAPASLLPVQHLQVDQRFLPGGIKDDGFVGAVPIQIGKNVGGTVAAAGGIAEFEIFPDDILQGEVDFILQFGKDRRRKQRIDIRLVKIAAGQSQQQHGAQRQKP